MKWLIKLIRSIFASKDKPVAIETPAKLPEAGTIEIPKIPGSRKRIALIVGHGNGDGGADTWNGSNEFEYNSVVAEYVKKNSKHEIEVFYRGRSGITGVAVKAVAWKPAISIELHLNSFNGTARGCEVLCLRGDNRSAALGRLFAAKFTANFNRMIRGENGIKWIDSGDRGATSLKALSPVAQSILVESFFADNKKEWIAPLTYAQFLVEWLNEL